MSDKIRERANEMKARGLIGKESVDDVAAFGRECAAKAYEDAAKIVYAQSRNRPAVPDALAKTFIAKAASLRAPAPSQEKPR